LNEQGAEDKSKDLASKPKAQLEAQASDLFASVKEIQGETSEARGNWF